MTKEPEAQDLVARAQEALRNAHAPYSDFHVGAALLAADSRVFTGCNVENASYGLTVCAERVAFLSAVAAGARVFLAIAVVADGIAPRPCGACLQVMAEFCDPDFLIFSAPADEPRAAATCRLRDLLPCPFQGSASAGPEQR